MTIAKNRVFFNIFSILTVFMFFFLLKSPLQAGESVNRGLSLCFYKAIPALFPFLILNELMITIGFPQRFGKIFGGIFSKLFNVNTVGAAAFVSGCLFGFPLGTNSVVSMYEKQLISKNEAERMICFCSNTGPGFIMGVIGVGLCSKEIAFCIYLSQIISAIIIGIALKEKSYPKQPTAFHQNNPPLSLNVITKAITNSVLPMLNICAFICFFSCISGALDNLFDFLTINEYLSAFMTGFLEITNGVQTVSSYGTNFMSVFFCAFFVGWSGLSVILQSVSLASKAGLSSRRFIISKLLQGGIGAVICVIACKFLELY